ncbi:DUF2937 family protein [Pseudoprimorskyibacter insulae]|uniref:DUF2937 domain-containing protein n=1 Tax=Pseudoprimorskyibacter insulae TaxID=1695997 RepID=A0A2R8ARG7_9RHOB|nr:DUF2937 family protein [Pseudoprimorskyibacter insulae]SPF78439.1 hypothetical protein PRI8871_01042 [Pseudoprimorskyibacter insulae]
MIFRALTFVAGLTGAAGLSQFPEFSQQYAQRLGGAVDELTRVVADFDADAAKLGLSRAAALVDMAGSNSQMAVSRAQTMAQTIDRRDALAADLAALQGAGPFTRASLMQHMTDPEIASRALEVYKPALPLTFEGLSFGGVGFALGAMALALLRRMLAMPAHLLRRRKPTQA